MGKQAMDVVTKQHCALGQQNWEGSPQPRGQTQVSLIAGRFFTS